ncbi:broad-complex core protein isoforms 1/2/3/4/5-like [Teleopsis dalmanni]|uniref:broad-complex core protein isoforms 1/2/3/4/5-like n=1 Tax=Teleopsis dalmanni TaxID=139649 RepID=UPI0018CD70B4|nr:broad-complex core protein isoforms 1/2/3/4/5-like [Teleopsis dalmanni]
MAARSHQYFSLRWNNYQNTMTSVFQQLREDLSFVDVTLSCEHGSLKAHKVVLSACSSYFQKLLLENPCKHPTIILPADIIFTDLKTIIDFVYRGEIDVTESELQVSFRNETIIFSGMSFKDPIIPAQVTEIFIVLKVGVLFLVLVIEVDSYCYF